MYIHIHISFSGKTAESQFRNLRNRYGREKRKLKSACRSEADKNDFNVKLSEIFPYLSWLEQYFVDGETGTNFQSQTTLVEEEEGEEGAERVEDYGISDAPDESINKSHEVNISKATGRKPFKRHKRKSPEQDDIELIDKLKERLKSSSERDEETFLGICWRPSCENCLTSTDCELRIKLTISCLNTCSEMEKKRQMIHKNL